MTSWRAFAQLAPVFSTVVFLNLVLLLALLAALWVIRRQQRALAAAEAGRRDEVKAVRERFETSGRVERSRLEAMLDAMIEGLVVIDSGQRIVLANRAAENMFGFSRLMAGGTLLEAIRHHEVATLARRALTGPEPIEHEVRVERPEPRVIQMSAVALHDQSGAHTGAVLVFHDVTRLRQLEAVRQDFVANVSHELRTPLSVIKSAAETLIDGGRSDPDATDRFLRIIDKHASRLTLLIDDLLLLARLDSGRVEMAFQRTSLRVLVQDCLDDAATIASARGTTLRNGVAAEVTAHVDPARLRQVLGNLIDNAIKYGRERGNVEVTAVPVGRAMIEIAIRDDGPGIPPEARQRIFERFFRVDKARSREQGGTGLGLAIVKNVVQAHGGEVRVESVVGQGTTFFFTVPAESTA